MATPAEILTMINDDITSNGNNEVTAAVLRPVLAAMVNQINALVGDEGSLPSPYEDVISALNSLVGNLANEYEDFTTDFNFAPSVSVGRYKGNDSGTMVTLPNVATNRNREITIINGSTTVSINTSSMYVQFDDTSISTIPLSSSVTLKSDGTFWYRII